MARAQPAILISTGFLFSLADQGRCWATPLSKAQAPLPGVWKGPFANESILRAS
jgi:hypothetical protein